MQIKAAFSDLGCTPMPTRADGLAKIYNDKLNRYRSATVRRQLPDHTGRCLDLALASAPDPRGLPASSRRATPTWRTRSVPGRPRP